MHAGYFRLPRPKTLMHQGLPSVESMQSSDREPADFPTSEELPPPPPLPPPEHELRDRAKAAKLRHRAAKARVRAHSLEEKAKRLQEKANVLEQKADHLDGVVRAPIQLPLDE